VLNARVIAAEALRKCPDDQMLYVLAAGVEHAGGDYELARTFCLRAYELDRTDKHLYIVWPKVMASLGEKDKARVSAGAATNRQAMHACEGGRRAGEVAVLQHIWSFVVSQQQPLGMTAVQHPCEAN
jgi:hypothetical protein